jgi:hypothetical protein
MNDMNDAYVDRISEYLDGELDPKTRREMEAHLTGCAACTEILEDLRRLHSEARSLPLEGPADDLWPGIEERIRRASQAQEPARIERAAWRGRRISFSMPQLAAACLAVAAISGAAVWVAVSRAPVVPGAGVTGGTARMASSGSTSGESLGVRSSDPLAAQDVQELRRILDSSRKDLDPATVRSLEESIVIIDVAIRQAQRALAADPANPYVRAHLDETMRRKVQLLHRATVLASATE